MPSKSARSPETLAGARARLEELESDLVELVDATREESKPVDLDQPIGRLSRMDAIQQQKMAQANRQRATIRLQQVRGAFKRLDEGTFGLCLECGEAIGEKRLTVRPESHLCIECQTDLEESAKGRW